MAHGAGVGGLRTGKGQRKDHHLPLKNINSSCLSFALRNIETKCERSLSSSNVT